MDPIAITASAVTFISACRRLARGLELLRDLSLATNEIRSLIEELTGLQNILDAINLVALRRLEGVSGLDLSKTFGRFESIITELCEICGLSLQNLKNGNEHDVEQLQLQLRDRFKWSREKMRVAIFCKRLKIVRVDLANQLAAFILFDVSSLTTELKALSAVVQNLRRDQGRVLVHLLGNDATIASSRASAAHLYDQGREVHKMQTFARSGRSLRSCAQACSCVCHRPYLLKSPASLVRILGFLTIKTSGVYGMSRACNEFACRRKCSVSVRISYRTPEWFLTRLVCHLIISNCLGEPQLALVVPRVIPTESEIFSCARAGDVDGMAELFRAGLASPCDIDARTGFTALHYAVKLNKVELCRYLLEAGARPGLIGSGLDDRNARDIAMEKVCSKILSPHDAIAFIDIFDYDEWLEEQQFSILHKIVLGLLPFERSLEEELMLSTSMINVPCTTGRTPLAWAADCGNVSAMCTLLHHGADFSCDTSSHWTPVHFAARSRTPECLSILLEKGCPSDARSIFRNSPLHIASFYQSEPVYCSILLDHGADIEGSEVWGRRPLAYALGGNNPKTAQYLILQGADPNTVGITSSSLLNEQVRGNKHDCISVLLECGADPSLADEHGEIALHVLARCADLGAVEIFQSSDLAGVDPEVRNNTGLTPWDVMAQRGGVAVEVKCEFANLLAKLDMQRGSQEFFDAVEAPPLGP